ncbi:MAG: DUF5999 family protein [Streptosporangiaceae bacterium]
MCPHTPLCPDARALDREAARTLVSHPEQGWSLLCNGIVVFEDTGELLPGGDTVAPHRPTDVSANSGIIPARQRRAAQVAAPAEPAA